MEEIAINVLVNLDKIEKKDVGFRSKFLQKRIRRKHFTHLIMGARYYIKINKIPKSFKPTLKELNYYYINNLMSKEDRILYSTVFFELKNIKGV